MLTFFEMCHKSLSYFSIFWNLSHICYIFFKLNLYKYTIMFWRKRDSRIWVLENGVCAERSLCMCVLSHVRLYDPMYCSPPDTVHRIFQARIWEQVTISYSMGSFQSRDWTRISCVSWICRWILYHWAAWEIRMFLTLT